MKYIGNLLALFFVIISYGQNSEIRIEASIDQNLNLKGVFNFKTSQKTDSLKIYKFSAGANSEGRANLKINSIRDNTGKDISYEENEEWYRFVNTSDSKEFIIDYTLDLNAIHDWREKFEHVLFPGGLKQCWYPDVFMDGERNFYKNFIVEINHPNNLTLITSGVLIDEKIKRNSKRSQFKAENILSFSLNAGWDFINETISNENISLSYFCPESKKEMYKKIALTAMEAVDWYVLKYGFFPKKHMGLAIGHPRWHGGFPAENMFYIHQGNTETAFIQWITSHELGHYYWGLHTLSATEDYLSPLMLSNGIWIDHLYLSEAYNKSFVDLWNSHATQAAMIEKYLATYLANYDQKVGYLTSKGRKFGFDYNSNVAHGKAAVGIYLLSNLIGVERYVELQKELLSDYKGKPLSIEDFIRFLEGKGYVFSRKFLEQWYKDHAIIEYDLYRIKTTKKEGGWDYSFEVRKRGTVDYPIDVSVIDEKGNITNYRTKAESTKEQITGFSKFEPVGFKLDMNGKVPMWNSDNEDVQRAFIFALYRAGRTKIAMTLAKLRLENEPNNERLIKLISVLETLGK